MCFGPVVLVALGSITAWSPSTTFTSLHVLQPVWAAVSVIESSQRLMLEKKKKDRNTQHIPPKQKARAEVAFSGAGGLRCSPCVAVSRHLWLVPNS